MSQPDYSLYDDRVNAFLDALSVDGESVKAMVPLVEDEFGITEDEAQDYVLAWLQGPAEEPTENFGPDDIGLRAPCDGYWEAGPPYSGRSNK